MITSLCRQPAFRCKYPVVCLQVQEFPVFPGGAELAELLFARSRDPREAEMAPASRIAARLADLSHAQLVEIAAAGCEASTEVKNRADALLAAHKPLAQWAVEGVLLSSDLVPQLLAPLQLEDGAAAAVCSRWCVGCYLLFCVLK